MSNHNATSYKHSQDFHVVGTSREPSSGSPSDLTSSCTLRFARPLEGYEIWESPPRGRREHHQGNTQACGNLSSTSSSTSSHDGERATSVRDIEDLETVINLHLNDLSLLVVGIEHTKETIERYTKDLEDLNWQMFLFRTGACQPRLGGDGLQSQEDVAWQMTTANKLKDMACNTLKEQESNCAGATSILYRHLKERHRRSITTVERSQEGGITIVNAREPGPYGSQRV